MAEPSFKACVWIGYRNKTPVERSEQSYVAQRLGLAVSSIHVIQRFLLGSSPVLNNGQTTALFSRRNMK